MTTFLQLQVQECFLNPRFQKQEIQNRLNQRNLLVVEVEKHSLEIKRLQKCEVDTTVLPKKEAKDEAHKHYRIAYHDWKQEYFVKKAYKEVQGRRHQRGPSHYFPFTTFIKDIKDMANDIRNLMHANIPGLLIWFITNFFLTDDLLSSYLVFKRRHTNIMERKLSEISPSSHNGVKIFQWVERIREPDNIEGSILSWVCFMSRVDHGHLIVRNFLIDKGNSDCISVTRDCR
ncbi:hypothetical protein BD777DRAFT_161510 [Yarrowia lipolytica]|nr:hypothetical protein BKA90DRAFT_148935 [Yarrowia lipolytica]RMI94676.1 hypothetical protein BD777DRAFT_161510 [Yarrowia lipolytica]